MRCRAEPPTASGSSPAGASRPCSRC